MRGQTPLDFAIGISIFLLVVVYVLAFVPGMLQPFVEGQDGNTIVADRTADKLAQSTLGTPEEPFNVSGRCTAAFFGGPDPGTCQFDTTASIRERLGLVGNPAGTGVNFQIELRGNVSRTDSDGADRLCWDVTDDRVVESDDAGCGDDADDTTFVGGEDPPTDRDSVVVSRRVVSVDGSIATLYVRMW